MLAGKRQRGLLEGRILLPDGQTFTVYVTHLDHTSETAHGATAYRADVARARPHRPHLVMGRLQRREPVEWPTRTRRTARRPTRQGGNLAGDGSGLRSSPPEKAGYVSTSTHAWREPGAVTFPTDDWRIRIDHLFASQALAPAVTNCAIWTAADGVSDHRPCWPT